MVEQELAIRQIQLPGSDAIYNLRDSRVDTLNSAIKLRGVVGVTELPDNWKQNFEKDTFTVWQSEITEIGFTELSTGDMFLYDNNEYIVTSAHGGQLDIVKLGPTKADVSGYITNVTASTTSVTVVNGNVGTGSINSVTTVGTASKSYATAGTAITAIATATFNNVVSTASIQTNVVTTANIASNVVTGVSFTITGTDNDILKIDVATAAQSATPGTQSVSSGSAGSATTASITPAVAGTATTLVTSVTTTAVTAVTSVPTTNKTVVISVSTSAG